jgi:hypothetical protein
MDVKNLFQMNTVYTFKLNSGEELIGKVTDVDSTQQVVTISEPVSVAPGPQGMGLVPSMFTADPKAKFNLNGNSIALFAVTEENVKNKYIEAITGIKLPEKQLVLG